MENKTRLTRALVVGHGRDGRRRYDPEAKRELVKVCLQPGTSVAKIALEYGINANLLRKWIDRYREQETSEAEVPPTLPAFAPVLSLATAQPTGSSLSVVLPNGVKLDLQGVKLTDLPLLLNCLAGLPCSASNPG
ncbi:transposase [Methylobacter sp. BlB1]|jgi:transposase|uniref:IS66-like element accessory protein TnpA n=1 Tax=Methylobacter sp. BlB1 TaxID=2785914 RepID=UPI00189618D9|nr:transposase [Methylobacter sp. BlB1]MBF6650919.1 transposase [Methylobacter sp. BlB1]